MWVNSSYSWGPSPTPRRPLLPWAPLVMTFCLSQWVGGGVDGKEQRERLRRGWGGGLDGSQGIPAPAACIRGPELPFLRFLCKPRQVSFEMRPGSHRPPVPSPLPSGSLPCFPVQVSREEKGAWKEPGALNGLGWGPVFVHSLTSLSLVFMGS